MPFVGTRDAVMLKCKMGQHNNIHSCTNTIVRHETNHQMHLHKLLIYQTENQKYLGHHSV